jgi:hypothetical protein
MKQPLLLFFFKLLARLGRGLRPSGKAIETKNNLVPAALII